MKKLCLFLLIALISLGLKGEVFAAPNMLENPSFETGNLAGWSEEGSDPAVVVPQPPPVKSSRGVFSARKSISAMPTATYESCIYQEDVVVPGGPTASMNMNGLYAAGTVQTTFPSLATARIVLRVKFLNDAGEVLGVLESKPVGGTSRFWRIVDVNYPTGVQFPSDPNDPDNKTTKLRYGLYLLADANDPLCVNGFGYFDLARERMEYKPLFIRYWPVNRGFEGLWDWVHVGPAGSTEATDQIVHTGTYALKKTVTNVDTAFESVTYQDIGQRGDVRPVVKAQLAIRTDVLPSGSQAKASLKLQFFDYNGTRIGETEGVIIGNAGKGFKKHLAATRLPAGTVRIRIICSLTAPAGDPALGCSAYFDTLKFTREAAVDSGDADLLDADDIGI